LALYQPVGTCHKLSSFCCVACHFGIVGTAKFRGHLTREASSQAHTAQQSHS